MQGEMVMPEIAYRGGRLYVTLDPTVPQLTPLLVSNPLDSFNPADPWYDALDPARQGLSFSRRYGFVMDDTTETVPPEVQIWIRKLSGPPELAIYRYRYMPPITWEPIFGTGGTTNALYWNRSMFHPAVTALPGTNSFTATFEAYLLDAATGQEVPGSGTGPFVLNWTNVPDGRPALNLAAKIVVSWPADTANYVLESAPSLTSATWTEVTNAPVLVDGESAVVLPGGQPQQYFRMKRVLP